MLGVAGEHPVFHRVFVVLRRIDEPVSVMRRQRRHVRMLEHDDARAAAKHTIQTHQDRVVHGKAAAHDVGRRHVEQGIDTVALDTVTGGFRHLDYQMPAREPRALDRLAVVYAQQHDKLVLAEGTLQAQHAGRAAAKSASRIVVVQAEN